MEISKNFINFQKKILKKTKYFLTNPHNINFYKNIKDNEIDTTISLSVFHYFYSNSYCENILREMVRTTRNEIFLFDIKDKKKKIITLKILLKDKN